MYSAAPMSTPRVGWAARITDGSLSSSLAMISFWMLPPDRLLVGVGSVGVLTEKASTSRWQCARMRSKLKKPGPQEGRVAMVDKQQVLADLELADGPVPHPFLGHVGQTGALGCVAGLAVVRSTPSISTDGAGAGRPQPGDGLGQLALPVAGHPGDADDLAGPDLQVDPVDGHGASITGDRERCGSSTWPRLDGDRRLVGGEG